LSLIEPLSSLCCHSARDAKLVSHVADSPSPSCDEAIQGMAFARSIR